MLAHTRHPPAPAQKLSIMRELQRPKPRQRAYVCQPLWLIGFIGVLAGAFGDFGALVRGAAAPPIPCATALAAPLVQAFAAQSLLIPLGGFTIIANLGCVPPPHPRLGRCALRARWLHPCPPPPPAPSAGSPGCAWGST
jgi:hypothetical protein